MRRKKTSSTTDDIIGFGKNRPGGCYDPGGEDAKFYDFLGPVALRLGISSGKDIE